MGTGQSELAIQLAVSLPRAGMTFNLTPRGAVPAGGTGIGPALNTGS
jgi:uncharacterized protein YidB (DUF937 family)